MSADRIRFALVAVLVVGAVASPFAPKVGLAVFVVAAAMFVRWRRAALKERNRR
jgi:Flp pilus assembly protein TadB